MNVWPKDMTLNDAAVWLRSIASERREFKHQCYVELRGNIVLDAVADLLTALPPDALAALDTEGQPK